MIRPPHNIQCKQHCLIACEQALRGVLRFKNSQLRQEFLNLIIHSCSFLKQYLKIQALTRTLTLVPKLSTLSSDRIRGRTRSGKALNRIYLSWAFFTKHACLRSRNDSYSQFPWSPQGTPGTIACVAASPPRAAKPLTPRPSEQKFQIFYDSIVSQFPEETWAQRKQTKYRNMTRKPRSHVRISIYRTCSLRSRR